MVTKRENQGKYTARLSTGHWRKEAAGHLRVPKFSFSKAARRTRTKYTITSQMTTLIIRQDEKALDTKIQTSR